MGRRPETRGERRKTAAEEIVGRERLEAYDSLGEALAVNAEIKEAKGRSVDDTGADWKRKAHSAKYTPEDAAACARVAEQLAADGTTAVNKGGKQIRGRDGRQEWQK